MTGSHLDIRPLHSLFCAEVHGLDLSSSIGAETITAIKDAWIEKKVLVFVNQRITDAQQVAFSRLIADLEIFPMPSVRSGAHPEIFRVANTNDEGELLPVEDDRVRYLQVVQIWHNDSSYRRQPSSGAVLRAVEVPREGGETWLVDMTQVYADLPASLKQQVQGRRAIHSFEYSRSQVGKLKSLSEEEKARVPPVEHPLVARHPVSNELALFLSPIYIETIVGMSAHESRELLNDLKAFALQDRYIYKHRWFPNDVMMWDNRAIMHAGQPYDGARVRRVMHRTSFVGETLMEP
jgi:alpha-ketoglutarate-dependent taurine dioxygenase